MTRSRSAGQHEEVDAATPGPDVRPLGCLALGCGVLSLLLALTLWFSPLAIPLGLVALGLGWAARTEESTRRMGTVAVVLGLLASVGASILLTLLLTAGEGG